MSANPSDAELHSTRLSSDSVSILKELPDVERTTAVPVISVKGHSVSAFQTRKLKVPAPRGPAVPPPTTATSHSPAATAAAALLTPRTPAVSWRPSATCSAKISDA